MEITDLGMQKKWVEGTLRIPVGLEPHRPACASPAVGLRSDHELLKQSKRRPGPLTAMREVTNANFGILVAYLLPGFVALYGLSQTSPAVRSWLITPPSEPPTIGGFLYLTVACLASGLVVSTLRWALIDRLHHATGIRPPELDFSRLDQKLDAFQLLVESHYRYYQFYANMFVAAAVGYFAWWSSTGASHNSAVTTLGFLAVEATLLLASRDTLRKYYRRSEDLLRDRHNRQGGATPRNPCEKQSIVQRTIRSISSRLN